MHWSFKTGYHAIAAKKFLSTGAPFPECKSWKRFHGPGSVEGWILVEADNADACYEHAAEWAECLDWEVTPVLTDDQAGPFMAKVYSWLKPEEGTPATGTVFAVRGSFLPKNISSESLSGTDWRQRSVLIKGIIKNNPYNAFFIFCKNESRVNWSVLH